MSTRKLVRALRTRNLAEATDIFSDIMSKKVAARIAEEKKHVFELNEDVADELAAKYKPSKQAKFKAGDKVKHSDEYFRQDYGRMQGLGDYSRKNAMKADIEKRAARRGTVVAAGDNGHAIGAVVRWDDGRSSESMQHMLMPASQKRSLPIGD